MAVRTKNRRTLLVGDRLYVWFVRGGAGEPADVLHVLSDDKHFLASFEVGQPETTRFVCLKGAEGGPAGPTGCWRRVRSPEFAPTGVVTPEVVRDLIVWCGRSDAEWQSVDWQGTRLDQGA